MYLFYKTHISYYGILQLYHRCVLLILTRIFTIQIYLFVDLPWCESIGVFSFPFSENNQQNV